MSTRRPEQNGDASRREGRRVCCVRAQLLFDCRTGPRRKKQTTRRTRQDEGLVWSGLHSAAPGQWRRPRSAEKDISRDSIAPRRDVNGRERSTQGPEGQVSGCGEMKENDCASRKCSHGSQQASKPAKAAAASMRPEDMGRDQPQGPSPTPLACVGPRPGVNVHAATGYAASHRRSSKAQAV